MQQTYLSDIQENKYKIHEEEAVAIGTALELYLNETVHDMESYIITIRRK